MNKPTAVARERYAGKRVTVVGLAREGTALVRFLAEAGARVTANDRGTPSSLSAATQALKSLPVEFRLGEHPQELFLASDHIFVSPGVPQGLPPLVEARRRGVPISSETQLFFELCQARIIGVTGSSGKTTTTALAGRMLQQAGLRVHVGGNIGIPLLERLDSIGAEDWVLLEMSSFQLETLPYSPHVGALLNVTPNHLDRHGDMESYRAAKMNILNHQRPGDLAVLNADDPVTSAVKPRGDAVWFSLEKAVEGSFLQGRLDHRAPGRRIHQGLPRRRRQAAWQAQPGQRPGRLGHRAGGGGACRSHGGGHRLASRACPTGWSWWERWTGSGSTTTPSPRRRSARWPASAPSMSPRCSSPVGVIRHCPWGNGPGRSAAG